MEKETNLIKIAKEATEIKPVPAKRGRPFSKPKVSPEEERDQKAKETVNRLLEDIALTTKTDETPAEQVPFGISSTDLKGSEWLQEQVATLTEQNERYKREAEAAKEDYKKILADYQALKEKKENSVTYENSPDTELIKRNLITVFNELQSNHAALGRNFVIAPVAFMNRLIMYFDFLKDHKKY